MSDLANAVKAAAAITERVQEAEKMAQVGTHEHQQIVSAVLMTQWPRIQFCLSVLAKQ